MVSTTNTIAVSAPLSLLAAKASTLLGFPEGSNFSPGENIRQIPVKDSSNSSMVTSTRPLAGSLRIAFLPRKPSSTTKWLKFQCMMHGKVACSISVCTSSL